MFGTLSLNRDASPLKQAQAILAMQKVVTNKMHEMNRQAMLFFANEEGIKDFAENKLGWRKVAAPRVKLSD